MARTADTGSAAQYLPERLALSTLREAAAGCRACPLWRTGTRTVFGRACGAPPRRCARRGRDRPHARLCDERRQALQVAGAGQAAHPREVVLVGGRGLAVPGST